MNREYANGIKNNILTKFFFYKLIACLTILIIAYAKAWGQVLTACCPKHFFITSFPQSIDIRVLETKSL